jgi:uncharacterized protein (TIGR02145 family)
MRRLFLLFSLFEWYVLGLTQPAETLTDVRDGQTYKIVKIGSQTWMAENLNFNTPNSWCYADSTINCDIYGRLYTWEAALNACPDNWHLPSDDEWKILEQYIGMTGEESNLFLYRGEGLGTKLKSERGWGKYNCMDCKFNTVGFNALPSGYRLYTDGSFVEKGKEGRWWSSTTELWRGNTYAFRRCIYFDKSGIDRDAATLILGFSIRCIKN